MNRTVAEQRRRLEGWFAGQVPDGWFGQAPQVTFDNDEILVIGVLPPPDTAPDSPDELRRAAELARIERFRRETREPRMLIAERAQVAFGRKVSWGASCGNAVEFFTTASVPVMTRLRLPERAVLDTLIDAGVARSRSEALAWCVRLVGRNESEWIADLRAAFERVETIRSEGPRSEHKGGRAAG